jgi:hypothetical protein
MCIVLLILDCNVLIVSKHRELIAEGFLFVRF